MAGGVIMSTAFEPTDEVLVVKVAELLQYMSDIGVTPSQTASAMDILYGVQGEVEDYIGRPIMPGRTQENHETDDKGTIFPKKTPITAVHSITADYEGTITYNPTITYKVKGNFIETNFQGKVVIDYSYGLSNQKLGLVRSTILRAAAREMEVRHDDTLSVKDLDTNEQPPKEPYGLTEEEERRLGRIKRRVMI